jgi:hypothetical protein
VDVLAHEFVRAPAAIGDAAGIIAPEVLFHGEAKQFVLDDVVNPVAQVTLDFLSREGNSRTGRCDFLPDCWLYLAQTGGRQQRKSGDRE